MKQLRNYGDEIAKSSVSRHYKSRRLWGPTRFWLFSDSLPQSDRLTQPPWELEGTAELLGPANWTAENLTNPIHPLTMSPLLTWAQLFVNEFSDEVISVVKTKNELRPNLRSYSNEGERERLIRFLDDFHATQKGLPGRRGNSCKGITIASQFISVYVGVGTNCIKHEITKRIRNGQILIESAPLSENKSIYVNTQPLLPFIDYYAVDELKQLLVAACVIVIAYLSGMRIEECRGLQRGCCKKIIGDKGSRRFEIWAKSYKGALDLDGNTIHGGKIREEPWHVVEPVAKAIHVMESLHSKEHLFSAAALLPWTKTTQEFVMALVLMQKQIYAFISWCNSACEDSGLSDMVIPEDPYGQVTTARFRRTLAWFIYRQPAGRISLGIQYGHLQGMTSDGYGSRASTGLRDLFPMEEAFARADSLAAAAEKLSEGELVSGPAADRYIKGVTEFSLRFQGKYLSARQAAELIRDPVFRIYDNGMQPLACCYDSAKAMCHPDREMAKKTKATPNLSRCDSRCPNAARTDSHIEGLRHEIKWLLVQSKSYLVPEPMRLRHRQRIASLREIIKKHKINLKRVEE